MLTAKQAHLPAHELPRLSYAMDSLQPYMSKETLQFHYGKHHRGYIDKLNALLRDTDYEHAPLEAIIRTTTGAAFNNAAQVWNHNFFWRCLAPDGGGMPSREMGRILAGAFGSVGAFKQAFRMKALEKFGSGWTWLVRTQDGRLLVVNTDDADTPLRLGARALLACDVWEHAYYIDYRNDRARYLDAYWNIVNWRFVAENLAV